ncbi:hypothetical protein HPP92_015744 [Vanilla planifolia]|uniref:Pentatricopeptide repeat-containing protein n=1 Tax=Vanilla planifolia TaxID=51239 RepID=A0A835QAR6_VANPL|nr:hypothetical protein HPP92_016355 [Vanilla planifolia]KAG0471198.1 hypothetical protein HPP92_015744 [Vanilla planifolia]
MRDYNISPDVKHYACMIDALGRSGNLLEAEALVLSMPMKPDGGIWGALLSACYIHKNVEMGKRMAERAVDSDPGNDGYYVLVSNIFGGDGRWRDVESLRSLMKRNGVSKTTGWSSVEIDGRIHVFTVGGQFQSQPEGVLVVAQNFQRHLEEYSIEHSVDGDQSVLWKS